MRWWIVPNFWYVQNLTSSTEAPAPGTSDATFDHGEPGSTREGGDCMKILERGRFGVAERRRVGFSDPHIVGVALRAPRTKRLRSGWLSLSFSGEMLKRMPAAAAGPPAPAARPTSGDTSPPPTGIPACGEASTPAFGIDVMASNGKGKGPEDRF